MLQPDINDILRREKWKQENNDEEQYCDWLKTKNDDEKVGEDKYEEEEDKDYWCKPLIKIIAHLLWYKAVDVTFKRKNIYMLFNSFASYIHSYFDYT